MARETIDRRLAAIMSADVVGYSRLMGADETGTLVALRAHRAELMDPTIAEHHGRVVKLMGDGTLVEFASVIDAVECAVAIQLRLAERNAKMPRDQRITYRIGINLGDVIIESDDIYGDGVNVAARLQELADPGGICVSGAVFEQVDKKVDYVFADLGDQRVKNIAKPVRVYRVRVADPSLVTKPRPFVDMSKGKSTLVTGGCLCGEVRYEISKPAIDINYCHCRMCQRFAGAPVVSGSMYSTEALRFTKGEPKYYKSSPFAERGFCANCGSSLTYRPLIPQLDFIVVWTASLDNPEPNAPTWHLGVESQMPWLNIDDDLPRTRTADAPDVVEAWSMFDLPVP